MARSKSELGSSDRTQAFGGVELHFEWLGEPDRHADGLFAGGVGSNYLAPATDSPACRRVSVPRRHYHFERDFHAVLGHF